MYTTDQIVAAVEKRRRGRAGIIEKMRKIKDAYNGDLVIPLPEIDRDEDAAVPNIILNGIDAMSSRIASVTPNVDVPPARYGDAARKRAEKQRMAHMAWWEQSLFDLLMVRRARWLCGYGQSPVVVKPDFKKEIPCFHPRDPLDTFPEPAVNDYDMTPDSCAFVVKKPWQWLYYNYPAQAMTLAAGRRAADIDPGERFEIIEWYDCEQRVLIGMSNPSSGWMSYEHQMRYVELDRLPTGMDGVCPVVTPGRVTLDRARGQFDAAIGIYKAHARMMALGMIAVEKDIFPDQWLIQRAGEQARFIEGPFDGRTGEVNIVEGTPFVSNTPPGQMHTQYMDRLERAGRITGAVPAELGGEAASNIRTGRRGEQVLESAISYGIAEAQRLLQISLQEENKRAVLVAKNFFGYQKKSFFVTAVRKRVEYTPQEDFETTDTSVTYPIVGTDAYNLTVMLGQLNGAGAISKATMRRQHPAVADPEFENDQIQAEMLELALGAAIQQQAAAGQLPAVDVANIIDYVASDQLSLAKAVTKAHDVAQKRQATSGAPGTPTGPVAPTEPAAQPGLSPAGMGAEAGTSAPPQDLVGFLQSMMGGGA